MQEGKVYHGKAVEHLKKLKDRSVHLFATDPPYEIGMAYWDYIESWSDAISLFYDKLKKNGQVVVFCGWSNATKTIARFENYSFTLQNWIAWDRVKGRGAKKNLISTREDILWFVKDKKDCTFNRTFSTTKKKTKGYGQKNGSENRVLSNVWSDISPIIPWERQRYFYCCGKIYPGNLMHEHKGHDKIRHKTQKPEALMERIINVFSNKGDLVVDPYAGTGTTAIACQKLDRRFIAVEKEKIFYKIIKKRLRDNG